MIHLPRIIKETSRGSEFHSLEDGFFQKRQIFMNSPVDAESSMGLIKQLLYLNQENPEEEITLYINCPGGEVTSGLAVYDCIRLLEAPIRTVCTGTAASMGSILFLSGDKREMLPHTKIMVHDPAFGTRDIGGMKPLEIQKEVDDLMNVRETLCEIIAERTGRTKEEIYQKTRVDSYFRAEEAVEFGLATAIITKL
ncbi:MAG: ATP-dependent Clp protease proteolytic subunit [Clostridium sp.]|nr:ATP-dependent Clp protease proteolytic subunit [Clostridium sp.]